MPIFSWSQRRQLAVFSVFAIIVLLIVFGVIYYFRPEPTCFDDRKNQDEEGIDCGGAVARCAPCSEKIHDLTVLWTRFFPTRQGVYDAAALLENGNQFLKTGKFIYTFKLYDESGVLIAIRENSTFIWPGEKFLIFEPNILAENRVPKKALLEPRGIIWEAGEARPLKIDILKKDILLQDLSSPRLEIKIKNQENQIYKNIEIGAVLLGQESEVLGVSKTSLDRLDISEEKNLVFTWPQAVNRVSHAEIFLRQTP